MSVRSCRPNRYLESWGKPVMGISLSLTARVVVVLIGTRGREILTLNGEYLPIIGNRVDRPSLIFLRLLDVHYDLQKSIV